VKTICRYDFNLVAEPHAPQQPQRCWAFLAWSGPSRSHSKWAVFGQGEGVIFAQGMPRAGAHWLCRFFTEVIQKENLMFERPPTRKGLGATDGSTTRWSQKATWACSCCRELIGLKLNDFEVPQHLPVEALCRSRRPLEPSHTLRLHCLLPWALALAALPGIFLTRRRH